MEHDLLQLTTELLSAILLDEGSGMEWSIEPIFDRLPSVEVCMGMLELITMVA